MSFESPETTDRKRTQWNEKLQALDYVVDKLGRHIDPGIKEAVAALQCSGFETDGSCEGHIHKAMLMPPYVAVTFVPEEVQARAKELREKEYDPVASAELQKLMADARRRAFAGYMRLMSTLDEFYEREPPPPANATDSFSAGSQARGLSPPAGHARAMPSASNHRAVASADLCAQEVHTS